MKSKRSKACDIPLDVKKIVWERDHHRCIICGSQYAMPSCHIISRARGGLGVEKNIITLCQRHHEMFDKGTLEQRTAISKRVAQYMKDKYGEIKQEEVQYGLNQRTTR